MFVCSLIDRFMPTELNESFYFLFISKTENPSQTRLRSRSTVWWNNFLFLKLELEQEFDEFETPVSLKYLHLLFLQNFIHFPPSKNFKNSNKNERMWGGRKEKSKSLYSWYKFLSGFFISNLEFDSWRCQNRKWEKKNDCICRQKRNEKSENLITNWHASQSICDSRVLSFFSSFLPLAFFLIP